MLITPADEVNVIAPEEHITIAEPDAPRLLGATVAATFLGVLGGLPPDWPDQTRVTISLELVKCIAAGQLAGQLAPLPPPGPNGNGRGPHD